jgi:glycerol-3-phosphate dehydrogenase (NAD+)
MYVYEEIVNGRKLTEIINQEHENVKYLPGHKFPHNVVSIKDKENWTNLINIISFQD